MPDWLVNLSQPQATLASGLLTVIGAVLAVFIGTRLFSGKVRDIRSALDATEKMLDSHQSRVSQSLTGIEEKLSSLSARTAKISADVADNLARDDAEDLPAEGDNNAPNDEIHNFEPDINDALSFEELASSWLKIRDRLEEIASDPVIDGRTAAKYSRISRRRYADLVSSLNQDRRLGESGERFRIAAEIWASHRTRRRVPSQADIKLMVKLASELANS